MSAERARCIVLGGSGALGRVVCAALAARGARVGLTYFTGEAVATDLTSRLEGAVARRLDLTRGEDLGPCLDEIAAALGGVDALVHCASLRSVISPDSFDTLADITEPGLDRLLAVNLKSAILACRHVVPMIAAQGGGNIVLLGSIDGFKTLPSPIPYAVSKAALVGLAQALAKETGKLGIRVNVVAPGVLDGGSSLALPDDLRREYLKHCALKRVGRLDEAAAMVAYMALENTYVTAQTIAVDGGL